ncbi:MAG: 50S ribosomal protein L21 [candidate division Zixibacteria bacterium CG_4_9_14_3_um_filter_46_8]|jgi:large subunit ribosomal protein L21|nr:MAG: 50S ribosomal protein L21 [candidate division Zixibacteria bacterium CG_4_9_14_3_um_filter_46_8]
MYAVIESSGMQFKVREGDTVRVPLFDIPPGNKINIDKVLMISDDDNVKIGRPYVEGAVVTAEVLGAGKDKKAIVFKFRRRVKYRVKKGHRQNFTELKISGINPGS